MAGTMIGNCVKCGQAKPGPIRVQPPGGAPPPFVCSDCLAEKGA